MSTGNLLYYHGTQGNVVELHLNLFPATLLGGP
jgi:hypothetical protein